MTFLPAPDEWDFRYIPVHLRGENEKDAEEGPTDLVAEALNTMENLPESDRVVLAVVARGLEAVRRESAMANARAQKLTEQIEFLRSKIQMLM